MTKVSTSGATPILDLRAPLPKPQAPNFRPADNLVPILVVVAVLASRHYQLLIPMFGFWVIMMFAIAIHELGHVAAGFSLGFVFQSVAIGPIVIKHESSRWTVTLRSGLLSGLPSMSLDRFYRVRKRLTIYVVAGPAAGLFLGVVALVFLRLAINRDDASLSLILTALAGFSIFINVSSLFPLHHRSFASDGMRLKVLLCSRRGTTQVLATRALEMQRRKGIDQFCLNKRWVRLASSHGNVIVDPRYHTYRENWDAYQVAAWTELAAQLLERCLASSAFLTGENRDVLIVEASVFTAWRRNDARNADIWLKRVASPERLHPFVRLRADVALSCASGRFDDALEQLKGGLEIIRKIPELGTGTTQEAVWLKWCREVEARRDLQSVAIDTES